MEQRHAEAAVREFLLFRGFTHTLRAFECECSADVSQGYEVDRIMELLFNVYVPRFEIDKLMELMQFLSRTLFSPADAECQAAGRKLDASLRKHYMVHAIQKGRHDRVLHFFEEYGDSLLQSDEDWQPWFSLPYVKNPSSDPRFHVYFSKEWLDMLIVSFRNFLCQFFDGFRLPLLVRLISKKLDFRTLKHELKECKERCALLERKLCEKDEELIGVKSTLSQVEALESLRTRKEGSPEPTMKMEAVPDDTHSTPALGASQERYSQQGASNKNIKLTSFTDDDLAFWPNDDYLYEEVSEVSQETFAGHTSAISRCRFSPSGSNIASASVDGTLRIWTYDPTVSSSRNATIYCGAEILSLDWEHRSGRLLFLGTAERSIKAWNVDAKRVVCDLSTNPSFPRVLDLKVSPTDALFVSAESSKGEATSFGSLTVWNMRTWKASNNLPLGEDPPVVTSICFNHNGKMLAAGASDGMIRLFDINGCLPITGWPAHEGAVNCVRFAPNQTSVFTMGSDGKVLEWSLHNQGQILQSLNATKFAAGEARHEMSLPSDGMRLLISSNLDFAPLYSFGPKPQAWRTLPHKAPITSVDWHPHLNIYLTGSADHSIHVTSSV